MQHEIQLGLPRAGVMAWAVTRRAPVMIVSWWGGNGKPGARDSTAQGRTEPVSPACAPGGWRGSSTR